MSTLLDDLPIGPPPSPLSSGFIKWCRDYDAFRMAEIMTPSRVDYYFSQSGDDANSGLTPSEPKQTIEEMNTILAGVSYRRCLLNRGDTWTTDTQVLLPLIGSSIGAWGRGDNPRLQQSGLLVPEDATWAISLGTTYIFDATAFADVLGRVIFEVDRDSPLIKQTSTVNVQNNGGYFLSGTDLYMNIGTDLSVSAPAFRMFPVRGSGESDHGVSARADLTWIDSIDFWGYGLSGQDTQGAVGTTDQIYSIDTRPLSGSDLVVVSNCGAFVYRLHSIAALSRNGGIVHVKNCRTGWGEIDASTAINLFNDSSSSTMSWSAFNNVGTFGMLPYDMATSSYVRHNTLVFSHGDSSNLRFDLGLSYGNTTDDGQYGFGRVSEMKRSNYPGDNTSLANHRDFIVFEKQNVSASWPVNDISLKGIRVNCEYDVVVTNVDAVDPSNQAGEWAWFINTFVRGTTSNPDRWFGITQNAVSVNYRAYFYGSYIEVYGDLFSDQARINRKGSDSAPGQGQYWSKSSILVNGGASVGWISLHNNDLRLKYIMCYDFVETVGTSPDNGYDQVTTAITATVEPEDRAPKEGDEWYKSGGDNTTPDGPLEYDFAGNARSETEMSVGRFEPSVGVPGGRGAMTVMITPDMKRRIQQGNPSIGRG